MSSTMISFQKYESTSKYFNKTFEDLWQYYLITCKIFFRGELTFFFLGKTDDTKGIRIAFKNPLRPSFSLESLPGVVGFSTIFCSFSFVITGTDSASVDSAGFVSSSWNRSKPNIVQNINKSILLNHNIFTLSYLK